MTNELTAIANSSMTSLLVRNFTEVDITKMCDIIRTSENSVTWGKLKSVILASEKIEDFTKWYKENGYKKDYISRALKTKNYIIEIEKCYTASIDVADIYNDDSKLAYKLSDYTVSQIIEMTNIEFNKFVELLYNRSINPELTCKEIRQLAYDDIIPSDYELESESEGEGNGDNLKDSYIKIKKSDIELMLSEGVTLEDIKNIINSYL